MLYIEMREPSMTSQYTIDRSEVEAINLSVDRKNRMATKLIGSVNLISSLDPCA